MSRTSRTPGLSAFSLPPNSSSPANGSPHPPPSRASLYASHGNALRASHVSALQNQLSVFKALLHNFALAHAETIRKDAQFRQEFVRMCRAVGVDPAAGSGERDASKGEKGWLAGLGGMLRREGERERERSVEIAVRVVEVCRSRRGIDGGLTSMEILREGVARGAGRHLVGGEMSISEADIQTAVAALKPLGSGFSIIDVGSQQMVRSVPKELHPDQARVLEAIHMLGFVTCSMLEDNLGWEAARAKTVTEDLVGEGVVWIDDQGDSREREYWATGELQGWED